MMNHRQARPVTGVPGIRTAQPDTLLAIARGFSRSLLRLRLRLYLGQALFGVSVALMVRAGLGLSPWDVFHQSLAKRTGIPLGQVGYRGQRPGADGVVSAPAAAGPWPVSNVVLVRLAVDGSL